MSFLLAVWVAAQICLKLVLLSCMLIGQKKGQEGSLDMLRDAALSQHRKRNRVGTKVLGEMNGDRV